MGKLPVKSLVILILKLGKIFKLFKSLKFLKADKRTPKITMAKSTIVITEKEDDIQIEVHHDPLPKGHRDTWNIPAKIADQMVRMLLEKGAKRGMYPKFEASLSSLTGELDITTRKKEGE